MQKPKQHLLARLAMHAAVYLGIIILLFVGVNFYLQYYTNHGQSLTVPDFGGMSMEEVERTCEDKKLRFTIKDSSFEASKPKLTVLEQNPRPYAKVKENRRIYLTLNSDKPPKVSLPNIKDVNFRAASRILESYGLKVGQLEYIPDVALNAVLNLKYKGNIVEAGAFVDKGSTIDLVLGDGARGERAEVPSLTGLTLDEGIIVLRGNYLVLGRVMAEDGMIVDSSAFIIYKQNPAPPGIISPGEPVNVYVTSPSRYKESGKGIE